MDVQGIASRSTLLTLKMSKWCASRVNKNETAKVNAANNTGNKAHVRVRVCEHPALAELSALHTEIYTAHVAMTRPTIQEGMRMMSLAKQRDHERLCQDGSIRHESLVSRFLADYPSECANAPYALNGLYDASAWPNESAIAGKFGFQVRYLACPTDGAWADWLEESAQAATAELRDQLEKAVRRVQERCVSDGRLYDTVFTGLRELLDAIPDLDIAGDSEIKRMVDIARPLVDYDADIVRKNDSIRHDVARQAGAIADMFGAISI